MYSSGKLLTLGWETCGGRGSYEINLKELIIPKHYLLISSQCGASPPGWAAWEITEFPTHQQYKIDVYINLYSSGKLLTFGWETNHIVVIAGVLEIP